MAGATINRFPLTWISSRIYHENLSITDLVDIFTRDLRCPVRDKTAVSGIFQFNKNIFTPPAEAAFAEVGEHRASSSFPQQKPWKFL